MSKNSIENILELSSDLRWKIGDDLYDGLTEGIYADASEIAGGSVSINNEKKTISTRF